MPTFVFVNPVNKRADESTTGLTANLASLLKFSGNTLKAMRGEDWTGQEIAVLTAIIFIDIIRVMQEQGKLFTNDAQQLLDEYRKLRSTFPGQWVVFYKDGDYAVKETREELAKFIKENGLERPIMMVRQLEPLPSV